MELHLRMQWSKNQERKGAHEIIVNFGFFEGGIQQDASYL